MAFAPINRLANAAFPIQKTIGEAVAGKSLYPDVRSPRPIRDPLEHLSGLVSAAPVYRGMKDIPQQNPLRESVVQATDPGENAYHRIRGDAARWLEKEKVERGGGEPTERSNALYYYRKALQLGNKQQAERWLSRYRELGGTDKGLSQSIKLAHPLSMVPVAHRPAFERSMSPEQRMRLRP
jgi:hypothetical protein